MTEGLSAHPGLDQLAAFRVGNVSPEELTAIERHLAGCPGCCRGLKSLPDDALVQVLRQSFAANTMPSTDTPAEHQDRPGDAPPPPAAEAVPPALVAHPRYRVAGLLGAGGMGAVYKAEHLVMERAVALKVISRSLIARPAVVERFRREVRAAARLSHPNIVAAYDADQAGDTHFLVMEYVEGTTLARLVQEQGPLPVALACEYARQAALGLQHASEHGMVHRDVKPQNLMLTLQGQVKILDFGLARLASELAPAEAVTASGLMLGTADYIAPEQADDPHKADIRADIYSLGCTLYFLLTGQPPFPEGTLMQKLLAHGKRTPRLISSFRNDLRPGLDRVLDRMTAKEPARRYQTPAEVAQALAPFARLAAHTGSTTEFKARTSRRRRPRWLLVAAAVAVLLLGAALLGVAVYRLSTDKGEFLVEVDDDKVEVLLAKHGLTVHERDTGRKYTLKPGRQDLQTGDYEIDVTEQGGGLEFSTRTFSIKRGGKESVKVTLGLPDLAGNLPVGEVRRMVSHTGTVRAVAYDPLGRYALSGSSWPHPDHTLRLWNLATGKQVWSRELTVEVLSVAFSPDGRRAVSAGWNELRLWEVDSGKELRAWNAGGTDVWAVAYSPDGKGILSGGGDGKLRLWDAENGKELKTLGDREGWVVGVAFSPDGRRAVSGGQNKLVHLWDLEKGQVLWSFEGHEGTVHAVAYDPLSRYVLTGGFEDPTVRLWNVETGKEIRQFKGHTKGVVSVAFSADGRRALSGGHDRILRLWDVATGKELHSFTGHGDIIWGVAFSPDGRYALSGSGGNKVDGQPIAGSDWTVRLWRLPDPPPPEKAGDGPRPE
jgi:WD40 repeat protein